MRHLARWAALCGTLLMAGCAARPSLPLPPGPETIRVEVIDRGVRAVREVPLEDYVAAVALSEFAPAAGEPRTVEAMYEVQAIIARTYAEAHRGRHAAEGFDLCSTTHCQLYEPARLDASRWTPLVREAVLRTAGVIVTYEGAPADAVYHADCGGETSAASDVWGGPGKPYLRAIRDEGPAREAHAEWQYAVEAAAVQRALEADPRTRAVRRIASIDVVARDGAGRAQRVLLHGTADVEIRGTDLRSLLAAAFGARSVRSTLFEVSGGRGRFLFSGRGFGHGVGLCQVGALARLAAGDSPARVLQHYYPGTTLGRSQGGRGGRLSAAADDPYIMDGHDSR